jgi:hypothetical protein
VDGLPENPAAHETLQVAPAFPVPQADELYCEPSPESGEQVDTTQSGGVPVAGMR